MVTPRPLSSTRSGWIETMVNSSTTAPGGRTLPLTRAIGLVSDQTIPSRVILPASGTETSPTYVRPLARPRGDFASAETAACFASAAGAVGFAVTGETRREAPESFAAGLASTSRRDGSRGVATGGGGATSTVRMSVFDSGTGVLDWATACGAAVFALSEVERWRIQNAPAPAAARTKTSA